ncbi:MAG: hypothetical protein KGZ80_04020 [Methylomonas sp.]|nr:hypothetical protein [Methylomonas sp.]PPD21795.1 MAG: hypothetical protein CTY23_04225 [Methylomonas sp.]PPD27481.1 MAG: hypothetical protein CTY22_01805 [Methylomonas sp.]PPD39464.1 MAG: hypothetical protein CTY21_01800 [Methylomonas sp.]PPD42264.1 MAG: hypothetical protein CTY17_01685 [Methylomonas sp.]
MTQGLRTFILLALLAVPLISRAVDLNSVPDVLKPWAAWVMHDDTTASCPFLFQDAAQRQCRWSGPLQLVLTKQGGRFESDWTLYRDGWLPLPGNHDHWPQQVRVDQNAATVTPHDGQPSLYLSAGHHRISGVFQWDGLPKSLALPAETGLISLSIDGHDVLHPRIERGEVWLAVAHAMPAGDAHDSLAIQVFRQVIDDTPMRIITRIELQASGSAREIDLPHAMLPGLVAVRLDSALPARLDTDGRLRVQLRPGRWIIDLTARHDTPVSSLPFTVTSDIWPVAEIWAFQAMPALRLVEIENLASIDPSQTNMPVEWQQLPAYRIENGQSMTFRVIRRGDPDPEPNQLKLHRTLWLDFDGGGYSVSDRIDGRMTQGWRLNAQPELLLGQVVLSGRNQLITRLASGQQGVEVRLGQIQLQADSRIEHDIGRLNAVGWQHGFRQAEAVLNIPPGWRLLAVSGVDNQPDTWLTRWTLLDLFLVLIAALAISRLWSLPWGLLALVGLSLIWHEADAPRWVWLNLLAALALLRVLPDNRFARWCRIYRNLCGLLLILITVPFMIGQFRLALYPQLERPWQPVTTAYDQAAAGETVEDMAAPAIQMREQAEYLAPQTAGKLASPYDDAAAPASPGATHFDRIDPDASLQTGPGLPQWQWQRVELRWNGRVDAGQSVRLWYLPPFASALLHVLQALVTALLALRLLDLLNARWRLSRPLLSLCLLLPWLLTSSPDANADFPDQALLEQLKQRLTTAPDCLPSCAHLARLDVDAQAETLTLTLEIHARQTVAVPLPVAWAQWLPQRVEVDGKPSSTLRRHDDDGLWLALAAGVHRVVMTGRHAVADKLTLPLPLAPGYTQAQADGWDVGGVFEQGRAGPQLELVRRQPLIAHDRASLQASAMPAFVQVIRTLQLGLDWQIATQVVRMAGNDTAVTLELPLLAGEAVTTPGIRLKGDKVIVSLAAGQTELSWQSRLEQRELITLHSPEHADWHEVWRLDVGPVWHVESEGLPVVHHQDAQGIWLPEWRPWPGEQLLLHLSRPEAVAGPTLTIDRSELVVHPGKRSQQVTLNLMLRSSKGDRHVVVLPDDAVLQTVSIDGVSQPVRQSGNTVDVPVRPGAQHIKLDWQQAEALTPLFTTPAVELGTTSVNNHIKAVLGDDRWVLFTLGPHFGPAALIWGLLVVLVLLSLGLSRIPVTPLKTRQWLLLLVGLSQIGVLGGLVVAWLLALGLRKQQVIEYERHFNLAQIGLGVLTLTALLLLFAAVQQGLLGQPDMQITGNQSHAFDLNWYQDRAEARLPTATIVSVPMTVYRLLMLGWSLWMAIALLDWLRWGWGCYSTGGLWRKKPQKAV